MKKTIFRAFTFVLLGGLSVAAQEQQVFKGEICWVPAEHAAVLEKNPAGAQCTANLGKHAKYVLSSPENDTAYQLDNQGRFKALIGEQVIVSGILDRDTGTIHVTDVIRAVPQQILKAKSVYIDCDACLRAMADAWWAAFEELTEWGRFDVVPDPKKADLIFLFSANPYLGDYVTRDGPDKRPVFIKITFMDVVDPKTGKSLWSDSRELGSWFVAPATRELFHEFKEQLAVGETQDARLLFLLDKDKDGKVSKQEFLKFMDAEFDRLDTDNDGELDTNELSHLRVVSVDK
jgi:hypothetical protein